MGVSAKGMSMTRLNSRRARQRAVFLDRDGVIVEAVPRPGYHIPTPPFTLSEFKLVRDAREALAFLRKLPFLTILVTNQPDVAKGKVTYNDWEVMQSRVKELPFDDVFICLHTRFDKCLCRKPQPGLLLEAVKKWSINLPTSYMIGDTENDVLAGRAAGCRTILIDAAYNQSTSSDYRVKSLLEAAELLKSLSRK